MILQVDNLKPNIPDSSFIANTAAIIGDVRIGENTSIWFNTVVRGDINHIIIGRDSNIQDNCTLHVSSKYPATIGSRTVIGHNAVVHACTIGSNVLVGIGATILDGAVIEDNVIIGAGTLITPGKIVKSNSVVMGQPFKVIRSFNEEDQKMIDGIILRYSKWSKIYKNTTKEVSL